MKEQFDLEFVITGDLEKAVRESDIVVTATPSSSPVIKGEWINEGCHISAVGSHSPDARELDDNIFTRSPKIVLDIRDASEAGDIAIPVRKGVIKIEDIHGEIGEIVAGKKEGRVLDEGITIFKSVGMAITDVSTATSLYEIARKAKMGTALDLV